jgi:hypothetical protein
MFYPFLTGMRTNAPGILPGAGTVHRSSSLSERIFHAFILAYLRLNNPV